MLQESTLPGSFKLEDDLEMDFMEDIDADIFYGHGGSVLEPMNGILGDCAALLHIKSWA